MIPKDSTPIKNEILTEIIAKGLLSKDEMRIIAYIIRWSWGFNGVGRRQDWTKGINITKIAKDIGMDRSYCNRIILRMIEENKIKTNNNEYQFNEHYEGWVKVTQWVKITRNKGKNYPQGGWKLPTKRVKITQEAKKISLDTPIKQEFQESEHPFKETLKETLKDNKEIISSQIKNLLSLFPKIMQEEIQVYWDNAAQKNKTGIITEGRKLTLLTELYNLMKRTNDNNLFKYALETANRYGVANIGYLGAVIKNKITEVIE